MWTLKVYTFYMFTPVYQVITLILAFSSSHLCEDRLLLPEKIQQEVLKTQETNSGVILFVFQLDPFQKASTPHMKLS